MTFNDVTIDTFRAAAAILPDIKFDENCINYEEQDNDYEQDDDDEPTLTLFIWRKINVS